MARVDDAACSSGGDHVLLLRLLHPLHLGEELGDPFPERPCRLGQLASELVEHDVRLLLVGDVVPVTDEGLQATLLGMNPEAIHLPLLVDLETENALLALADGRLQLNSQCIRRMIHDFAASLALPQALVW